MHTINLVKILFVGVVVLYQNAIVSSSTVVISKIYGGGESNNSTYNADFVELSNIGHTVVSLQGLSVQYASATGGTWNVVVLTNQQLNPGQHYLIALATSPNGLPIPTPDVSKDSLSVSATQGKLAIVDGTAALTGSAPNATNIKDYVGFGNASFCEGQCLGPLSAVLAAVRNCSDTNNNAGDFQIVNATDITIYNSSSPLTPCPDISTATAGSTSTTDASSSSSLSSSSSSTAPATASTTSATDTTTTTTTPTPPPTTTTSTGRVTTSKLTLTIGAATTETTTSATGATSSPAVATAPQSCFTALIVVFIIHFIFS